MPLLFLYNYVFSGWDVSETFNVYDDSIISGSWSEKKNMEAGTSFVQETAGLPEAYAWKSAIVYNNEVVVVGDGYIARSSDGYNFTVREKRNESNAIYYLDILTIFKDKLYCRGRLGANYYIFEIDNYEFNTIRTFTILYGIAASETEFVMHFNFTMGGIINVNAEIYYTTDMINFYGKSINVGANLFSYNPIHDSIRYCKSQQLFYIKYAQNTSILLWYFNTSGNTGQSISIVGNIASYMYNINNLYIASSNTSTTMITDISNKKGVTAFIFNSGDVSTIYSSNTFAIEYKNYFYLCTYYNSILTISKSQKDVSSIFATTSSNANFSIISQLNGIPINCGVEFNGDLLLFSNAVNGFVALRQSLPSDLVLVN